MTDMMYLALGLALGLMTGLGLGYWLWRMDGLERLARLLDDHDR
jgi:hypothetical protein